MESAKSESRVQAVLLSQLCYWEIESQRAKTKTERVLAAAKCNALRDLADMAGLDDGTWAYYSRLNQEAAR